MGKKQVLLLLASVLLVTGVALDRREPGLSTLLTLAAAVCLLIGLRMKKPVGAVPGKPLSKRTRFLILGGSITAGVLAFYFLQLGPQLPPAQHLAVSIFSWIVGLAMVWWGVYRRQDPA